MARADITASYRRNLERAGETVQIYRGAGAKFDVRARVYGLEAIEAPGSMSQIKCDAIVLADDLIVAGFPLPFQTKVDRMIWNGRTLVIQSADDGSRVVGELPIAYVLTLRGS